MTAVLAIGAWSTNGDMIADCAQLGYLRDEWRTLDPTWGLGRFWTVWRPRDLVGSDLDPEKSPTGSSVDATNLPHPDCSFDAVVIDGPYKLNGTATTAVDSRYGVDRWENADGRHRLLTDMLTEGERVLKQGGFLLFKCQDQVNSGRVRWQSDIFTRHAEGLGMVKVDALLFPSYRPQPDGRRQLHARRNYSTLLVFTRSRAAGALQWPDRP